ncbi:ABC transporter permease [Micromonospora humi]|uniref:Putative ABC transport system permease protein n=1 Tax=Micromonospora humi TaxID=745366 RepID=A0A1C5J0B0_9ACTN|nr:ABC transporter permease [Micromonospora humi]SCG64047.1 putative ABC transport system permease protein [Micromonospora humi]
MIRRVGRLVLVGVPLPRDLSLAWRTVRGRRGGFVGSFVALLAGSALITACGTLLMSGLGAGVAPERYSGAAVVLGAPQSFRLDETSEIRYRERVTLPAGTVTAVAAVPGVASAIGDVDVAIDGLDVPGDAVDGGLELLGHGWSAAALGPFRIGQGRVPAGPDEVVLDAALADRVGVAPDATVRIVSGSVPSSYRVVGLAEPPGDGLRRQSAVFFTDDRARELSGHPHRVDAVGVLAAPGVTPEALAARIGAAVPEAVVHTGTGRGDVEFLDVGDARTLVVETAASFGGTMVLIVMFVVGSTLGLSLRQRRRELALLRAIGATPRQIRRMVGAEMTLVALAGALVGTVPGIALAFAMRAVFVGAGAMPPDFPMRVHPAPTLAALLLCLVGARLSGWLVARRATRLSPVQALGEAEVEPPRLGRLRVLVGVLLVPLGLLLTVGDVASAGDSVPDTAASAVLVFVAALGCLGPLPLRGLLRVFGRLLNPPTSAGGYLAGAAARAGWRRLGAATTPLAMGVALAAVQVCGAATSIAGAQRQVDGGLRADRVLTASSGMAPQVVDAVRGAAGVAVVTPVARTQVLVTFPAEDGVNTRVYAAQGVTPDGLARTMDLAVLRGDLTGLRGETVALSRVAARTTRAEVGGTVELRLGDGTVLRPRVLAVYENGLGFGDVTLPNDLVVAHTTSRVDTAVLVRAADGTGAAALAEALRDAVRPYPTVRVGGRDAFATAPGVAGAGDWALDLMFQAVLLGYLAITVVNTLVMATTARVREFAILRLVGAGAGQVRAMMNGEARIVIVAALTLGLLAAVAPLVGFSLALTRSPVPGIPVGGLAAIVALTTMLSWGALTTATRITMRLPPVEAIGGRE